MPQKCHVDPGLPSRILNVFKSEPVMIYGTIDESRCRKPLASMDGVNRISTRGGESYPSLGPAQQRKGEVLGEQSWGLDTFAVGGLLGFTWITNVAF